jgi:cytoskeletal protein RodZ
MKPDRRSHRTIAYGLGVSVAIHFAVLSLVHFSAPDLERSSNPLVSFKDPQPVTVIEEIALAPVQDATPVDATAPEMEIVGESLAGAAATSAATPSSGQPSPATAPANGDPVLPATETGAASLTQPVENVTDPALAILADSARDETTSEAEDDDVPIWRPGSVGKAKRQWANNGSGAGERGDGEGVGIFIGRGGGHCPMPGRGRARPPVSWFN